MPRLFGLKVYLHWVTAKAIFSLIFVAAQCEHSIWFSEPILKRCRFSTSINEALLVDGEEEEEDGWDLSEPVDEEVEVAISGEHRNGQTQRHVHNVVREPVTSRKRSNVILIFHQRI